MCDYSLHNVASRPAKVGDKLVATDFARTSTRGFSAIGEPAVAVCLLPGTEIAFEEEVYYERAFGMLGKNSRQIQSRPLPPDQRTRTARASRCPGISRWPDCDGHVANARAASHRAAAASSTWYSVRRQSQERVTCVGLSLKA